MIEPDIAPLVERYRLPGECDDCAIDAAAMATGYPDNDYRPACENEGCRFYDAAYAAFLDEVNSDA